MPDPFHVRFNIDVPIDEARRRFINRTENRVLKLIGHISESKGSAVLNALIIDIESALGESHLTYVSGPATFITVWRKRINGDLSRCLIALEKLHQVVSNRFRVGSRAVSTIITESLADSETDIGISWHNELFLKKGAILLDDMLVNESLRWLADLKYQNVLVPFQKGLSHLLEGTKDAHRYGDAVTDMYEALEAMVKIVTGKAKDLSALREEFISKLKLTDSHKRMLKEYIDYGCNFRHGLQAGQPRTWPLEHEAENFVYMTGMFIRLAIQTEQVT